MKLISYKINEITDGDDYSITFSFDDGSIDTQKIEIKGIEDTYQDKPDAEGNKIVLVKAEDSLHAAVLAYAKSYIAGKEIENNKSSVHPAVENLIGQERKVE